MEPTEHGRFFVCRRIPRVGAFFDAVAQPVAHLAIVDVHELEADLVGIDLVEHADHLVQLHRLPLGEKVSCDLFVQVFLAKSEALDVERGVGRWLKAQRVDPCLGVADRPVGVDKANQARPERRVDLGYPQRVRIRLSEACRDRLGAGWGRGFGRPRGSLLIGYFLLELGRPELKSFKKG